MRTEGRQPKKGLADGYRQYQRHKAGTRVLPGNDQGFDFGKHTLTEVSQI